jgi:hypothetical protein
MTGKKITYDLGEIEKIRKQGLFLQALLHHYHLNAEVIRYLLTGSGEAPAARPQKVKALLKEFSQWYHSNDDLRAILNKGSFKSIKLWMKKMETFFKDLQVSGPPARQREAIIAGDQEGVFTVEHCSQQGFWK